MNNIDDKDKELLNLIQRQIPLQKRPFKKIGDLLEIGENEVIERINNLKKEKIIREIRGIFNAQSLGYSSILVAFEVAEKNLEKAAKIINSHPGVSHNYLRNHRFNLWFTLALPSELNLEKTVEKIYLLSKAKNYLILPAIKVFKIGVNLDASGTESITVQNERRNEFKPRDYIPKLSSLEISCIKELQNDLPLEPEPFKELSERIDISQNNLIKIAKSLIDKKIMRRMSAVLYHRNLGFKFNAMVVWVVDEKYIDKCGKIMASFNAVSHCYQRPTYPNWPYSLFTMIHCRKEEDCYEIVKRISEKTGIKDYEILSSLKEFKKKRVVYFSNEFYEWDKKLMEGSIF
ncbi:MAG: Lrp/AsnC family transcriptional regulator [Acidobacteriota bacterium]